MILGRGTAQTDEAIIAEYHQFLERYGDIKNAKGLKNAKEAAGVMCRRIGKSLFSWEDEDILAVYEHRGSSTRAVYSIFLSFLLFRGYRQASIFLLGHLAIDLRRHWAPFVEPHVERLEQAARELGYSVPIAGKGINVLLWLLAIAHKPLEAITREDFNAFRDAYDHFYDQTRRTNKQSHPDARVHRLERYLIHWGIFPLQKAVVSHEQLFHQFSDSLIKEAILLYLKWCDAKYQHSTIKHARAAVLSFFLWFQELSPMARRLDEVTRSAALHYAQFLQHQHEEKRYSAGYRNALYSGVRRFFDFVLDERLDSAPSRNPFSVKDLPRRPDMVPRYFTDHETKAVLTYCEQKATLLERTVVITLLHTGIRAAEFAALKSSDIVQIGGIWKLHIHEGKGLKDRLIPLTSQCLTVLQTWQEKGWVRTTDFLFTHFGRPWTSGNPVGQLIRAMGRKAQIMRLSPHRFRHTFAVALLNYGIRESALQKLMGHASLDMTLDYARILDETVEKGFTEAIEHMQDGPHSWIPNFFVQEEYTLFAEGDSVSWIRLPMGYCRRNAKLHCESDVKCLLCDRFAIGKEDLPRLKLMYERFMKLSLKMKADVVAAQIQRLELPAGNEQRPQGFIPTTAISVARKR